MLVASKKNIKKYSMKIILSILLVIILFGCRDTQCPAFPKRLLIYLPHEKGELLRFKNLNNDTLVFIVKDTWASGPNSFDWNCKCSCISEAGYETEINDKYSLRIYGGINIFESNFADIGCVFYDGDSIKDQFALEVTGKDPYSKDNSAFFGDSIIIDQEENARIVKVKIIEGKGIVEFFDKKENCKWIKIE